MAATVVAAVVAAAAATDSPADQARKYDAMLGQARTLIAQKKFENLYVIVRNLTNLRKVQANL